MEMAYRLRNLLGPGAEPVDVEMVHGLEKKTPWKQPHVPKWWAKTHGHDDHVCMTLHIPKVDGRSTPKQRPSSVT